MMVQDVDNDIYFQGFYLNSSIQKLNFSKQDLDVDDIKILACGSRHFVMVTSSNNFFTLGNVFDQKPSKTFGGFQFHNTQDLFDGGEILDIECRYNTFSALVKH